MSMPRAIWTNGLVSIFHTKASRPTHTLARNEHRAASVELLPYDCRAAYEDMPGVRRPQNVMIACVCVSV